MLLALLIISTLFVAYANGANDNFKGVATLYGSSTTSFGKALWIGSLATLAGCIASVFLADALVKVFSGKGLVPDAVSASPHFLSAVAAGAASTVMLATVLGFPISTTHALTGALVGAGYVAADSALDLSKLGTAFILPLLLSPLLALFLAMPFYRLAHVMVNRLDIGRERCICLGPSQFVPTDRLVFDAGTARYWSTKSATGLAVAVGSTRDCVRIPAHVGHPFRRIPATCSDGSRPPVPIEAGHP